MRSDRVILAWQLHISTQQNAQLANQGMGEESYQCFECGGGFDVDWGEGTISYHRVVD